MVALGVYVVLVIGLMFERGIGLTPDVAGLFESVDDPGHGAGGQAHQVRQATSGRGTAVQEDLQRFDIGLGETEAERHGLTEDGALEVDAPQRAEHGVDLLAVHLDKHLLLGNYLPDADNARRC